jgi:hypothetical protein
VHVRVQLHSSHYSLRRLRPKGMRLWRDGKERRVAAMLSTADAELENSRRGSAKTHVSGRVCYTEFQLRRRSVALFHQTTINYTHSSSPLWVTVSPDTEHDVLWLS